MYAAKVDATMEHKSDASISKIALPVCGVDTYYRPGQYHQLAIGVAAMDADYWSL